MMTFTLYTLGCKVNQYETQQIRQLLEQAGYILANKAPADLVVINTCCITHSASAKSRQAVSRLARQNPAALIVVVGCLASDKTDELPTLPGRYLVVSDKSNLLAALQGYTATFAKQMPCGSKPSSWLEIKDKLIQIGKQNQNQNIQDIVLKEYKGQTRAFLKIQDGCDAYCTYCIIPKIRTQLVSKPPEIVLQEARQLIDAGHKEIVLTGIFLGAYGKPTARRKAIAAPSHSDPLIDLIDRLAGLEGLERLRLSSLEPADVSDDLLALFQKHPNLMPHLHLPLQSGSPNILKKMARQYTIDQYLDVIYRVRKAIDRPAITTDIIVGFPGETDQDFEKTIQIANMVQFAKMHIFSFSPRKNTPAAKMTPKVPADIIHQRAKTLKKIDRQLQYRFQYQFIGQPLHVLVETLDPPKGRCERYFQVCLSCLSNSQKIQHNEIIRVVLTEQMLCDDDQE